MVYLHIVLLICCGYCIVKSYKYLDLDARLKIAGVSKYNYQRKPIRRKCIYWLLGAIPFGITLSFLL